MRKASLQKGLQHTFHPLNFTVDSCFSIDDGENNCLFHIIARNEDRNAWRFQKSYNELRYSQYTFNDLKSKTGSRLAFPAYKNEKRLSAEIQSWLNEVADACALSLSNYQLLLNLAEYQEYPDGDHRKGRLDASLHNEPVPLSLTIPARLDCRSILKCGHLLKLEATSTNKHKQQLQQPQQQQWKLVYLVLTDVLSHYESDSAFENGGNPRGICKLDAYCVIKHDASNSSGTADQFEFSIMQCKSSQSMTFRAMSKEEMDCWCQLLTLYPDCV